MVCGSVESMPQFIEKFNWKFNRPCSPNCGGPNANTDQDADKGLNRLWLKVAGEGVAGDALAGMVVCSACSDEWSRAAGVGRWSAEEY